MSKRVAEPLPLPPTKRSRTSEEEAQTQHKRYMTRTAKTLILGLGTSQKFEKQFRYRTEHTMHMHGFLVFTLENHRFQKGTYSALLAEKFQLELLRLKTFEQWARISGGLSKEPNRRQIPGYAFGKHLNGKSEILEDLIFALRSRIEYVLRKSEDQIRITLECYPTLILNHGETTVQHPHTDWKIGLGNRYSVIMALTGMNLVVALGEHPSKLERNLEEVVDQLVLHSLRLDPGEIICFHGSLVHAGGKNPEGALRLHWYASENISETGVPVDSFVKIKGLYRKGQRLRPIEKLE